MDLPGTGQSVHYENEFETLFVEWRSKAPAPGLEAKIKLPDPPKERIFEKR